MSIPGVENLGDWGKMTPVNPSQHITQTNGLSRDGLGVHITTEIPGTGFKVHDRFDSNGNSLGTNFAQK